MFKSVARALVSLGSLADSPALSVCGCLVALAALVAAFYFGPVAVVGWVVVVAIVLGIASVVRDGMR